VREVLKHYELSAEVATGLDSLTAAAPTDDGHQLRFASEKSIAGNTTVSYVQTYHGVPVWRSGFAVRMEETPMQVIGSQSSMLRDVAAHDPPADAPYLPGKTTPAQLATALGIDPLQNLAPRINQVRLFIYRYRASQRTLTPVTPQQPAECFINPPPSISLPPVTQTVQDGNDYFVTETYFTWSVRGTEELNWIALVAVESGSVLYLRPLVSCLVQGLVFDVDPVTRSGDPTNNPAAVEAALNGFRQRVDLLGLLPPALGQKQELQGEFVKLVDVSPPAIPPPAVSPPGHFDYSATTNDFSAVNAYHHCDRAFRMVRDLGFNTSTYFDGTKFPVRVDHRASFSLPNGQMESNIVNAQAPGNVVGKGSDGFRFALARLNSSVGLANDWRVVLHEFGHAILWDHVDSPNFGFSHSAGDSLAAILNDPGNNAERELTFPWVASVINRRHDRTPAAGWAWYGPRYDPFNQFGPDAAGYLAEQMLSTTMFRIYRSAGGDSTNVAQQQFAAHYVAFLILKAVGLLSPMVNANSPEDFAAALIEADTGSFLFDGQKHHCGTLSKVIRWSFELQGAFQAPGSPQPVFTRGAPPDVDVYIGHDGQYPYQSNYSDNEDVWVRHAADGGATHQVPLRNTINSVYLRVKNRGTKPAQQVHVAVFRSMSAAPNWPADWQPLMPASQVIPTSLASGQETVVGPFSWAPTANRESLLAIVEAEGDPANATMFSAARPITSARLAPLDNNMAQRTLDVP
jgi:hypothetical protein